ncbi:MAG: hypothetical protein HY393_00585 [Candidatus Diapherotrites archaeon]|nr:hypothetical protein [Candidatus Diapherotrites archaeon]
MGMRILLFTLLAFLIAGCLQLPPSMNSKIAELNALHDQFLRPGQLVPDTANNTEIWQARLEDFTLKTQAQPFEGKEALLAWVDIWLNANAMQRTLFKAYEGFGTLTRLHTDCSKASAPGKIITRLRQARDQADALVAKTKYFESAHAGLALKLGSLHAWKDFAGSVKETANALEGQIQVNCRTF